MQCATEGDNGKATEPDTLGLALRFARQRRGYLQYDTAAAAQMSPSILSAIETDARIPTPAQLSRLCAVLGIDPSTLPAVKP